MKHRVSLFFISCIIALACASDVIGFEKQPIKALYIPLADHYAGIVAYEKYKGVMKKANYIIKYLHKAGIDIENACKAGGEKLAQISAMIRKHIPEHTHAAIIQSLDPSLRVINYRHLNVDKEGLNQIMDYAIEGRILKRKIDIDAFTSEAFSTTINEESPL